ncbi:MAG: hypothetical protein ACPL7G_11530, partial [Chloroflexia bacterium]
MDEDVVSGRPKRISPEHWGYFRLLIAFLLLGAVGTLIGIVRSGWTFHLGNWYPGSLRSGLQADYRADPRDLRFAPLAPEVVEAVVRDRASRFPSAPVVTPSPVQPTLLPTASPVPTPGTPTAGPSPTASPLP